MPVSTVQPYSFIYYGAPGGPTADNLNTGKLESLTLPTLGKLRYTWRGWKIPTMVDCEQTGESNPERFHAPQTTPGIGTRQKTTNSNTVLGVWTYDNDWGGSVAVACAGGSASDQTKHQYTVTTVTTPLLDQEKHYFAAWMGVSGQSPLGHRSEEQGLPFSRHASTVDGGVTRYLSREILDCTSSGTCGTPVRKIYSGWEFNNDSCEVKSACGNRREWTSLTKYLDDGSKLTYVERDCFDGMGHYRKETSGGTIAGGGDKVVRTEYNPGRGILAVDDDGNQVPAGSACFPLTDFTPWPVGDQWVLGTYQFQTVSEPSAGDGRTDFGFDLNTGFLSTKRIRLVPGTTGSDDVVTTWTRTDLGGGEVRIIEKHFGGDVHDASSSTYAFKRDSRYHYGTLKRSGFDGFPTDLNGLIDKNTGLFSRTVDGTGLKIDYSYDKMGRITRIKNEQGTWVQYQYTAPSGNSGGRVTTYYRENGQTSGSDLAREQVRFDGLGRVVRERRLMPGAIWSDRFTTYDEAGNKKYFSEWGDANKRTQFKQYDAFGRASRIVPPEGASYERFLAYTGVRLVEETSKVGIGGSGGTVTLADVTKKLHYDRHGRLRLVEEDSAGSGTKVDTTYSYDFADRLTSASTSHNGTTQTRSFAYDPRGFLTSENHPERSTAATYSLYDSLGNVGYKTDAWRKLCYRYDGAGRPTKVERLSTGPCDAQMPDAHPLKEWTYATSNGSGDWRKGKVTRATRHNLIFLFEPTQQFDVAVHEDYVYGGIDGRVSSRVTEVRTHGIPYDPSSGSLENIFSQGFTYNALGAISSLSYPKCDAGNCLNYGGADRTVSRNYDSGFLASIPGYVNSISYHSNQAINQIAFASGVGETHDLDPYNRQRTRRIQTTGVVGSNNWDTGTYSYDGVGNVTRIGTSWYRYDEVSRLKDSGIYLGLGGGGTSRTQSYSYDAFGNLTNTTGNDGVSSPVVASTNRLNVAGAVFEGDGSLKELVGKVMRYNEFGLIYCYSTVFPNNRCNPTEGDPQTGVHTAHIYTADDERIWSYDLLQRAEWAIRDLGGQILREYTADGGVWTAEDNIYGAGRLLAAETSAGRRYMHTDHLGTVRLITDSAKNKVAYHVYYPFGKEATAWNQDTYQMKFTGHERDFHHFGTPGDDVDYMHARYYYPVYSRFTSTDPINSGKPAFPQSWNKYTYARGNPLKFIDPDGLEVIVPKLIQGLVDSALEDSPLLKGLFEILDADDRVSLTLELVSDSSKIASSSTEAKTTFKSPFRSPNGDLRLVGTSTLPRLNFEKKLAHELTHTFEALFFDTTPNMVPGAKKNADGYETGGPDLVEEAVGEELKESRRAKKKKKRKKE